MNIKIGTIIKDLRTENNITQDSLATAIGVTPQAISRWEAEGGYPDIELLPAIADFFSVTIDELMGYRLSEREERLSDIKKEMTRLAEVGTIKECIDYARLALTRYPSDHEIKDYLAGCLYCLYDDTKDESFLPEAERLALSVAENCKDEDIRYNAVTTLIRIYAATARPDKALEMTELLTPMKYCRETAKSLGIGDGNTEVYIQDEIDKLTDSLGTTIQSLVLSEDLPNDPSTWDKKIKMMETSNDLYRMIYGDELMFYHDRLAFNYWIISTYQMAQGKTEETLISLEKMREHAIAYDISYQNDHGKYYTSVFVDKLTYPDPGKDFHEPQEHSQCWYMLDRIAHNRYDPIRKDERFQAIIQSLEEYSR